MTLQEKVRRMGKRMNQYREEETQRHKQHCFSLLHDAVIWTGDRIDEMSTDSLVGYIQLATVTKLSQVPSVRDIRMELLNLGFNTSPLN